MGKRELRKQLTALSFAEKTKLLERLRDRSLALASARVEMVFDFPGDAQWHLLAWYRERLRSIGTCLSTGHPEAVLALVYSGIDVMGWLAAPADKKYASEDTFVSWCNKYLVNRLQSVEGHVISGNDLWSARCGFLHTSIPTSRRSDAGQAYEIWYRFRGKDGVDLLQNAPLHPLGLDVETLAWAFREGGKTFIEDLNADHDVRQLADSRAQHFLRWGTAKVTLHTTATSE
jgi:hypothetical protein